MRKNSRIKLLICLLITGMIVSLIPTNAAILFKSPKKDIIVQEFVKNKDKNSYKQDQLVVRIRDNNYKQLKEKYNVNIEKLANDTYVVNFDNKEYSTEEMLTLLNEEKVVEYAEPNYVFSIQASMTTEPMYNQQWGLNNVNYGININPIWDDIIDQNEVVVAVVDTGYNYNHPDLTNGMWSNTDEIKNNGLDDDHNGYIDDYNGWNFASSNNNVMDNAGHGSHVSGIIGAGINDRGVAGVVPNVKIMPLKVSNDGEQIALADIISAVNYASNHGVKIFNFSFGSNSFIQSFYDLLEDTDALFICAAGNGGEDQIGDNNDIYPFYPASYDLNNVISVAAIDNTGSLADFSNYGVNSVDLAAPGENIISTYLGSNYQYMNGTSMAAPFVTAALAILYAENPAINLLEIKGYLLNNVKEYPFLDNKVLTSGIIDLTTSYYDFKNIVTFDGGNGSLDDPYLISTARQLDAIRNDLDASYKLMGNIDLSYNTDDQDIYPDTIGWLPIGNSTNPFTGTFDGSGYTISNLLINRPDTSYLGLFGYVIETSIDAPCIYNLKLNVKSISGKDYIGSLIGYGEKVNMENISVTTNITSSSTLGYLGGVVGYIEIGTINKTSSSGSIISNNSNDMGGIAGYFEGNISLSYNEATIQGKTNIGGIGGYVIGNIDNVFSVGAIEEIPSVTQDNIGGIVGYLQGNLNNSYDLGSLHFNNELLGSYFGFIVGKKMIGTVTNSYYYNPYHLTNNTYGIELTEEQIHNNSSYTGFDFDNVWEMNNLPSLKDVAFTDLVSFTVPTSLNVVLSNTYQKLNIDKTPNNILRNNFTYTSNDESIVKIDMTGNIIPIKEGTTTVSVHSIEFNATQNITITVHMIKGDLNGDTNVTTTDLVILRRYLAGLEQVNEDLLKNGDVNNDEIVSLTDLVKLRRFLAGLEEL